MIRREAFGRDWLAATLAAGWILVLVASQAAVPAPAHAAAEPSADEIARLVAGLGAADYAEREAAASRLAAIGAAAVDPLLTAAETSDDLEVALRARWIVDTIPLETVRDPPEVAKLLDKYKKQGLAERVQVMHRLLRVDNDGGIEPLARIVRLDRSPTGSRVAAALLAREWRPDDPYWPAMRDRIAVGLGASTRPAAEFLRALVAFSAATDSAGREQALAAADRAQGDLDRTAAEGPGVARPDANGAAGDAAATEGLTETTLRIFQRCRIEMLLAAGRRAEAVAKAGRLIDACFAADKDPSTSGEEAAATVVWLVEHGLPEGVDLLAADHAVLIRDDPLVAYAAAIAEKARGRAADADRLASEAFAKPAGSNAEFVDRLQTAILLAKWGAADWAAREYAALVDNPKTPAAQFALAAIMYSEFLHDQEREDEAAACLERLIEGRQGNAGGGDPILQQIGREPQSIRSRMHFFTACAAAARGDAAGRRKAIEAAIKAQPKDVDALIALYTLPDNSPEQRADAAALVKRALKQIENEIQALPDDANGYNEYAWLVANTEGDLQKATRHSKTSLVKSFDSSSYLDTLAHCHAAAGNKALAIRTQLLALRQEPHNRTIRRNLERFRGL
jgi:hypothetical protein